MSSELRSRSWRLASRLLRVLLVISIVAAHLCWSYRQPLVGSVVILVLAKIAWPRAWTQRIGLAATGKQWLIAVPLVFIAAALAEWSTRQSVAGTAVTYESVTTNPGAFRQVQFSFGQTLNEEVVLGALLLLGLCRLLSRVPKIIVSLALAGVFAALHVAFYAWRTEDDPNYGQLSALAVTSVFLVGVLRHNLILGSGHIAYSWAIHFGWNVIFFGGDFYTSYRRLGEPERFDLVLGSLLMLLLLSVAATVSFWIWRERLLQASAMRRAEAPSDTGAPLDSPPDRSTWRE